METKARNTILLLILVYVTCSAMVCAQGDYLSGAPDGNGQQGRQATVSKPLANIRYGPDSNNYRIVLTLKKGATVTVYSKKGEWYAIDFPDNGKVWIFKKYIDVLGNDGTVNADHVTLRADSRFTGLPIGEANRGDRVKILSRQGKWLRISPPSSLRAYIHSNLIQLASEEQHEMRIFKQGQLKRFFPDWGTSPEGKHLRDLEKQLYSYKQMISFKKSKNSELNKTKKDIKDIQEKCRKIIQTAKEDNVREGASVVFQKSEKIIEYIEAVLRLRMLLEKIKEDTENKLKKLESEGSGTAVGGHIDDVGRFIGRPSRYVLKKGDRIICFLVSKKYDLKDYYYTEVAITEYKRGRSKHTDKPVLLVKDMEVKGRHPWKSMD